MTAEDLYTTRNVLSDCHLNEHLMTSTSKHVDPQMGTVTFSTSLPTGGRVREIMKPKDGKYKRSLLTVDLEDADSSAHRQGASDLRSEYPLDHSQHRRSQDPDALHRPAVQPACRSKTPSNISELPEMNIYRELTPQEYLKLIRSRRRNDLRHYHGQEDLHRTSNDMVIQGDHFLASKGERPAHLKIDYPMNAKEFKQLLAINNHANYGNGTKRVEYSPHLYRRQPRTTKSTVNLRELSERDLQTTDDDRVHYMTCRGTKDQISSSLKSLLKKNSGEDRLTSGSTISSREGARVTGSNVIGRRNVRGYEPSVCIDKSLLNTTRSTRAEPLMNPNYSPVIADIRQLVHTYCRRPIPGYAGFIPGLYSQNVTGVRVCEANKRAASIYLRERFGDQPIL